MKSLNQQNIRLFNVAFSPNLGDGVLTQSLEKALIELGADPARVRCVDLAARKEFSQNMGRRASILAFLDVLPKTMRAQFIKIPLNYFLHQKWKPHYEKNLEGADLVVIGGGNLLVDFDLNFPTKIASVIELTATRKIPYAIYGVGVSPDWSASGTAMMKRALQMHQPAYVSVRDKASQKAFEELFGDCISCPVHVVKDPGILVSRYVEDTRRSEVKSVGLCITSAVALRYHSELDTSDDALCDFYEKLIKALNTRGFNVTLFANGAPEDRSFLAENRDRFQNLRSERSVSVAEAVTPHELLSIIQCQDAIVAHRMHALIAAFSYNIPIIALRWDRKIDSFMKEVALTKNVFESTTNDVPAIAKGVTQQMEDAESIDNRLFIEEALMDVGTLVTEVEKDSVVAFSKPEKVAQQREYV